MKHIFLIAIFSMLNFYAFGQNDSTSSIDTNSYRLILANGNEFIGKILSQDKREIVFQTNDNREMVIPQYEIKSMELINTKDFNANGGYVGEDKFATRYFLTTNGLPIKKGEHYIQWNLFGPDFQFGIADNFGVGVMTSWFGIPLVGTLKYSFQLGEKSQFAVGFLGGSGTWIYPDWGGVLPYGTLSFGSRKSNLAFSGGYGAIWADGDFQGRALTSIAGMVKISPKLSLVFDSFVLLPGQTTYTTETYYVYNPITGLYDLPNTATIENKKSMFALLIPGLRWHLDEGKAFQFGFTGVYAFDEFLPVPIPMVQWYRSL